MGWSGGWGCFARILLTNRYAKTEIASLWTGLKQEKGPQDNDKKEDKNITRVKSSWMVPFDLGCKEEKQKKPKSHVISG